MRIHTTLVLALILCSSLCLASVPPMINYQGKLMQPSGVSVPDGTYSMQFAIYDFPTGGTALWSETNPSVQVSNGLFSVLLGSIEAFADNIFDNPDRWFGVKVGDDQEMIPRQQIASVVYAQVAGTVPAGAITTDKLADQSVTAEKLMAGAATPIGTISMFAGANPPEGWLLCDGSAVSRHQYGALLAVIGTAYGTGDGSTTFNLPNLQDRFPLGHSEINALGSTGGTATHTLTIAEMPVHTHAQNPHNHVQNAHSHGMNDPGHKHHGAEVNGADAGNFVVTSGHGTAFGTQQGNNWGFREGTSTKGAHTGISVLGATATNQATTAVNQNSGGGQPHNNMPPYLTVNYIIKY